MQHLAPTTPLGCTLLALQGRVRHARRSQAGSSAVDWLVIVAIVVGVVAAAAAMLLKALHDSQPDGGFGGA